MRIAFMGTPDFAVRVLADLIAAGHEIAAVYTQPPKPRGRGHQLMPSPVGAYAAAQGLEVRTPVTMRDPHEINGFKLLHLDAAVVVAFGQILLAEVLDAPRHGCFNLHASLLPRWRGAAPIQRAIMAGDRETGVEFMRMTPGLDEGPILMTAHTPVTPEDTFLTVHDRLAGLSGPLAVEALKLVEHGAARERAQPAEGVTYARKISTAEARIDWSRPAAEVDCAIRGLSPFPGAWFMVEGPRGPVRVKALMSRLAMGEGEPGEALDDGLKIACGGGAVRLTVLQREGKGPQEAEEFLRGLSVTAGTMLA